jgi:Uma2 family endonuclease
MTFAEFEMLPTPMGRRQELHHGEVIEVSPPTHGQMLVQLRLRALLEAAAGPAAVVETRIGYKPVPEHEYWVADVMLVSREYWDSISGDGYVEGPPKLVIEVLSPSNTAAEIRAKKKLCLDNGSNQFWVVDKFHREIEVSTPDGRAVTYKAGQQIPLFFALAAHISVDDIFA